MPFPKGGRKTPTSRPLPHPQPLLAVEIDDDAREASCGLGRWAAGSETTPDPGDAGEAQTAHDGSVVWKVTLRGTRWLVDAQWRLDASSGRSSGCSSP